jgi:hypothetical protein
VPKPCEYFNVINGVWVRKGEKNTIIFSYIDTLIAESVESSRICIISLSEGHESPHAAPIDS